MRNLSSVAVSVLLPSGTRLASLGKVRVTVSVAKSRNPNIVFSDWGNHMARGDHIFVEDSIRGIPFQHHGIDLGDGFVIHLAPEDGVRFTLRDTGDRFCVRRVTLDQFADGRLVRTRKYLLARNPEQVATAAESMLGRTGYSLLDGNCEHFATSCATGEWTSHQIEMSQASLACMSSAATKAVWTIASRIGVSSLLRGATKAHPALLIADGVEFAALSLGCKKGLEVSSAKRIARASGSLAAFGIGAVLAGPVGALVSVATHEGSRKVGDEICNKIRKLFA